jgi:hypothetical protein
MTLDERTLKLLELEYVDDLGNSLSDPIFIAGFLKSIYTSNKETYQECNLYHIFSDKYATLKSGFEEAKEKLAIADNRSKEHTLFFELLKNYFSQIEIAIEALSPFLKEENSTNFKEKFKPYLGYLYQIENAGEGITSLEKIYSGLVDANALSNKYCTKCKKASEIRN